MDLSSPVSEVPLVGPSYVKKLKKLGINTVEDLLLHVPSRYKDLSKTVSVADVKVGETVTVKGTVTEIKNIYTKNRKRIQTAILEDRSGHINAIWFNQTFLTRTLKKGLLVALSGTAENKNEGLTLISPDYELLKDGKDTIHTGRLVPVYPETYGVSSKWLRSRIEHTINLLTQIDGLSDYMPQSLVAEYHLIRRGDAFSGIHFPKSIKEAEKSRHRLSFDELLMHQLTSLSRKNQWQKRKAAYQLKIEKGLAGEFIGSLPFTLTASQNSSIKEILSDLNNDTPMNRLLEGDVGSGKTVVAAAALFAVFANGYQSVIMAPTQILAQQHYQTLKSLFAKHKVRLSLITSSDKKKDLGKADIFIGTHALIHKKVDFDKIGLVVIDEQHKFGVEQRTHLVKKAGGKLISPHILTMTATPIPRTIMLTMHGDLDLSVLSDMPKGRKKIKTWIVPHAKRDAACEWIDKQIKNDGIQAFFVCPLIEDSESESMKQVKSATAEYEKLKGIFPDRKLGVLHGRMKPREKDDVMEKFKKGNIDILVSTPVVEVGIDIPNATIMVVETADRFGLAQLHQLRGRVGRGDRQSYCLLFAQNASPRAYSRLKAMEGSYTGSALAEIDLKLRGPGEIFGTMQHGYRELRIARWNDKETINDSKKAAEQILEDASMSAMIADYLSSKNVDPN